MIRVTFCMFLKSLFKLLGGIKATVQHLCKIPCFGHEDNLNETSCVKFVTSHV
jgi:hypothetical protein